MVGALVSLLSMKSNHSRLVRFERVEGTPPERGLPDRLRDSRFVRTPIVGSMEPLSSLSLREMLQRAERATISAGMIPERP